MKLQQLSLFSENKPGHVIAPCRLLAREGIDIRALSLADTQRFGILRMIVSDWQRAKSVLEAAGSAVKVTEVVAVEVPDRPGGLADVLSLFEGSSINIEYMYAFPFLRGEKAVLIFRFDQPDAAIERLQSGGHQRARRRRARQPSRGTLMPISKTIAGQMEHSSWIRRMFEEGARLKRERGAENVFDYTLGNPDVEPPAQLIGALKRVVAEGRANMHGYMPNAGFPAVRAAVAAMLQRETGLDFMADDVFMTVGSAGACNVILKSILDPGDEVIVLMPCFSEYQFYISNHAGTLVPVETDEEFLPDFERIAAAITPRTRAILLNTPNNPTGRSVSGANSERAERIAVEPRPPGSGDQRRALQASGVRWRPAARGRRTHRQHGDLQLLVEVAGTAGRAHRLPGVEPASGGPPRVARRLHICQSDPRLHQRAGHLAAR